MKVKLAEGMKDNFLTPNKEYIVLAIEIQESEFSFISYRILPDKGCPILVASDQMIISCSKLSSTWRIKQESLDYYTLQPEKWSRDGFWEDYYNDDPKAVQNFKIEKEKIFAEEG